MSTVSQGTDIRRCCTCRSCGAFLKEVLPAMIIDIREHAARYQDLHPGFQQAFAFLARRDLHELPPGRQEIDGDHVFALVSRGPGRARQDGRLETHEKYIDIQHVVSGIDEMGWKPLSACASPAAEYDADKDVRFFTDEPDAWFPVRAGMFAVFFPGDAHLPLISTGEIHKIVVKVAVTSHHPR